MSEPVSARNDEGRCAQGRVSFVMQGQEAALAVLRGQLLRSSIFCPDSVLSAGALLLLNTSGRPPLWCCVDLQPCVNEVNIQ